MKSSLTRRALLGASMTVGLLASFAGQTAFSAEKITLRLSSPSSETDQRAVALMEVFAPAVSEFATLEPHWNASLFKQGTELEAIARDNLEMSIASAQELAVFFPEFSIFTAGYVHRDAAHQVAVFNDPLMDPFKKKVEDGSDAWQFLGRALGANPTPMAFTEVYTALQTGAVDGQDNPLPTVVDAKFYEVTKQIILTSHLVDLNYIAMSKKVFDSLTPEQQVTLQAAADAAAESGRQAQLKKEEELVSFLRDKGLDIYEPDLDAFRSRVQRMYLESEFAKSWPEGI